MMLGSSNPVGIGTSLNTIGDHIFGNNFSVISANTDFTMFDHANGAYYAIVENEPKNKEGVLNDMLPKNKKIVYERGYKSLYQKNVLPATLGCDFNFLQNKKIK